MTAAMPRNTLAQLAGLLILAGILAYSNSFSAPLVFDGTTYIANNPSLGQLWPWRMDLGYVSRPVGSFTFALNYVWQGTAEVWGYHVVNLAIHLAAGLVLFGLARRTLAERPVAIRYRPAAGCLAFSIALLWLVHPLETQGVTYIYQRLESLMSLFYLLTLYCFVRAQDSPRSIGWYAASVACCALGMGTKEVTVTAPLCVLWYDRVFVASSWRQLFHRRGRFYIALASTWAILVSLLIADAAKYKEIGVNHISPLEYALSQPAVILHYLRLSFWPSGLCLDYYWPVAREAGQIVPPLLAIAALLAATLWCIVKRPAWGFVLGSFFLILAPTSSISPVVDLAFEHRMYLPLASVVVVVVLAAYEAIQRRIPKRGRLAVGLVSLLATATALGIATFERNKIWANELSLWQDVVTKRPENPRAHLQLAVAQFQSGESRQALDHFDKAIALYQSTDGAKSLIARAYMDRGHAESSLGLADRAIADYGQAIRLDPRVAQPYQNRGILYVQRHENERALRDLNQAIKLDPGLVLAYLYRGAAYAQKRDYAAALADFEHAVRIQPNLADAYNQRAMLLATAPQTSVRNGAKAVADARRACELTGWRAAPTVDTLAAAYAEAGDFRQAIRWQQEAISLAGGDEQFSKAANDRLELYRAGKPLREKQ